MAATMASARSSVYDARRHLLVVVLRHGRVDALLVPRLLRPRVRDDLEEGRAVETVLEDRHLRGQLLQRRGVDAEHPDSVLALQERAVQRGVLRVEVRLVHEEVLEVLEDVRTTPATHLRPGQLRDVVH